MVSGSSAKCYPISVYMLSSRYPKIKFRYVLHIHFLWPASVQKGVALGLMSVYSLSQQFVVITVCLKAGLETSSWTMVRRRLSPLPLMFRELFPVAHVYATTDTCDIFYIALSSNVFMDCPHWACNCNPSKTAYTIWKLLYLPGRAVYVSFSTPTIKMAANKMYWNVGLKCTRKV